MAVEITGAELAERIAGRPLSLRPEAGGRPRCLVAVARAERGLSRCLVRELALELPAIEFVLRDDGRPLDAIWCCGFERDTPHRVRALRRDHPTVLLLVSGSGSPGWRRVARSAGADLTLPWTASLARLEEALSGSRARRA